jgi:hypothetical protein
MLADALRRIRARRVILLIDACQSGGTIESLAKIANVKLRSSLAEGQTRRSNRLSAKYPHLGIYLVAAATPLEEAAHLTTGDSALVISILRALKAKPGSGDILWAREVVNQVRESLPGISETVGVQQTPVIIGTGVDFPIAVNIDIGKTPENVRLDMQQKKLNRGARHH